MDISIEFVCGKNIIPYDVLSSSTACWLETRVLAIGICPVDSMDPMDQMSIGHFTRPLDSME